MRNTCFSRVAITRQTRLVYERTHERQSRRRRKGGELFGTGTDTGQYSRQGRPCGFQPPAYRTQKPVPWPQNVLAPALRSMMRIACHPSCRGHLVTGVVLDILSSADEKQGSHPRATRSGPASRGFLVTVIPASPAVSTAELCFCFLFCLLYLMPPSVFSPPYLMGLVGETMRRDILRTAEVASDFAPLGLQLAQDRPDHASAQTFKRIEKSPTVNAEGQLAPCRATNAARAWPLSSPISCSRAVLQSFWNLGGPQQMFWEQWASSSLRPPPHYNLEADMFVRDHSAGWIHPRSSLRPAPTPPLLYARQRCQISVPRTLYILGNPKSNQSRPSFP